MFSWSGARTTFNRRFGAISGVVALTGVALIADQAATPVRKVSIAHRGASGYAPEHTLAAYQLAIDQKADLVEQDLAVTKDGVLICLHDDSLERTSNVEEVFPDRFTTLPGGRGSDAQATRRTWLANDFTLAEIRQLDFGSWFNPKFSGARVVTWDEAIALVRKYPGVGMYPELKSPPLYTSRGIDMMKLFVESVKRAGLDQPASMQKTPILVQSFDEPTIRRAAVDLPTIPRVFLTSRDEDISAARIKELATFATGIAPTKAVIARDPAMVARAHAAGLSVTSWTFASGGNTDVAAEMSQFLYTFGIDALFTNNPDLFPRR